MHVSCLVEPSASPELVMAARRIAQMRVAQDFPQLAWTELPEPEAVEVDVEGRRLLRLTWEV